MNASTHPKLLQLALPAVGLIFTFAVYPFMWIWPSGWAWHTGQTEYLTMIIRIYVTLEIFLLIASKDPLEHRSLIWFMVWSSIVHGGIMAVQVILNSAYISNLYEDGLGLFIVAGALT